MWCLEGGRAAAGKDGAEGLSDAVGQGELQVGLQQLLDVRAADLVAAQLSDADDLDRAEAAAVAGSQVLVALLHSLNTAHTSILLVHVVGAGARVVAQPDAEILDLERTVLVNLAQRHNLAVGALDLLELAQKVEEAGLGDNLVRGKDAHLVELGGGLGSGRQAAADDLVLVHHTCDGGVVNGEDGWMGQGRVIRSP